MSGFLDKLSGAKNKKNKKNSKKNQKNKQKPQQKQSVKSSTSQLITGQKWQPRDINKNAVRLDVFQTPDEIIVKADMNGVDPKNMNIEITDDNLTIEGKTESLDKIDKDDFYFQERHWGSFSRSIILPVDIKREEVKAKLKHGLLTITLPKSEKEKTKKINIEID